MFAEPGGAAALAARAHGAYVPDGGGARRGAGVRLERRPVRRDRVPGDGERAFAFQQRVLARTSTRTRPLPWGTAYFHDDFPLRYDANMAIVDRPLAGRRRR